jgi:Tissue inhibitor of metalloproteinase
MKTFAVIFSVLVSLLLHQSTYACECRESPTVAASLENQDIDYVFRGYVKRQIDMGTVSINAPKYYSIRVWRVYKGCTFTNATSIVLTTAGNSALCGVNLALKQNYVFSGRSTPAESKVIKKAQEKNPKIITNEMVQVGNCDFNAEFLSLSSAEKNLVRKQTNVCKKRG